MGIEVCARGPRCNPPPEPPSVHLPLGVSQRGVGRRSARGPEAKGAVTGVGTPLPLPYAKPTRREN